MLSLIKLADEAGSSDDRKRIDDPLAIGVEQARCEILPPGWTPRASPLARIVLDLLFPEEKRIVDLSIGVELRKIEREDDGLATGTLRPGHQIRATRYRKVCAVHFELLHPQVRRRISVMCDRPLAFVVCIAGLRVKGSHIR